MEVTLTDIVERLRAKGLPPPEILHEAADTIERLRAALQQIADDDYCSVIARRALEPKP